MPQLGRALCKSAITNRMADAFSDTLLQHLGEEEKPWGAVVPPVFQNSLFVFDRYEDFSYAQQDMPDGPPFHYSRVGNPTLDILEKKLAHIEGTEDAKVFGSGMAAISAAMLSVLKAGSHVVVVDTVYGVTKFMLEQWLPKFGVTFTYVSGLTAESVLDAIQPNTDLIYLESPSSLVFQLQPIEAITKEARARGIVTMIDNTYSTGILQRPAEMGVDIVVHSASKYLNGHSDVVAGALMASRERIVNLVKFEIGILGGILAPLPAWLMLRGLRTLPLRLKRHGETADVVAEHLAKHPRVERVFHVSRPDFPQRDLFAKQMKGSGGLFSFEPKVQDKDRFIRIIDSLNVFQLGVSWGGFESLSVPLLVKPLGWNEERYIIRLFCGLESPQDLIADLDQALTAADA